MVKVAEYPAIEIALKEFLHYFIYFFSYFQLLVLKPIATLMN